MNRKILWKKQLHSDILYLDHGGTHMTIIQTFLKRGSQPESLYFLRLSNPAVLKQQIANQMSIFGGLPNTRFKYCNH